MMPVEVIAPDPTVPASVTLAPLNVAAVVVPDLIMRFPLVFVAEPKVVPPSLKKTSPPSASSMMSPPESRVNGFPAIVAPFIVNTSVIVPATVTPNRNCPSSDPLDTSTASAVILANSWVFPPSSSRLKLT